MNWHWCTEHFCQKARVWAAYARAHTWRLRGAQIGRRVSAHKGTRIDRSWGVTIGSRSSIEPYTWIKLVTDDARVSIGEHCFVGAFTQFDVLSSVRIGNHTLIAPNCFISDHDHGLDPRQRIDQQQCIAAEVNIGSDVWIGAGATILKGVSIGNGAVVGAGAVITRDLAPFEIAAGIPARPIRRRC